ncbi:MAG TPA: ubiquitin-like domain-containing protein [Bacillota bacterium]|nr:ubiquitin-like domain-containing protein [Bacillota bacterium]
MQFLAKLLPVSHMKMIIICLGGAGLLVFASFVTNQVRKVEVVVAANGKEETVQTHAHTVEELLDEIGIAVGKHDELSPDLDTPIEAGMNITYKTANKVIVNIDDAKKTYYTTKRTIGEFLQDENLALSKHDDVSHKADEKITDGLQLDIHKAFQITIKDDDDKTDVWTTGGSVEDVLNAHDIKLDKLDKTKPARDQEVTEDTDIDIVRVEKTIEQVEEAIPFETEKQYDETLAKGEEKVIEQGREGIVVLTYEITTENGEEVDRELVDEEVTEERQNRTIAIGTNEAEQKATNRADSESDKKEWTMTATAYTANCGGCSGQTATGINLQDNPNRKVVAVDPSVIPLGSKVWVEGYGEAVAGDTGGAISGNRIDVHVPSQSDANRYGWQQVKVKIID